MDQRTHCDYSILFVAENLVDRGEDQVSHRLLNDWINSCYSWTDWNSVSWLIPSRCYSGKVLISEGNFGQTPPKSKIPAITFCTVRCLDDSPGRTFFSFNLPPQLLSFLLLTSFAPPAFYSFLDPIVSNLLDGLSSPVGSSQSFVRQVTSYGRLLRAALSMLKLSLGIQLLDFSSSILSWFRYSSVTSS